MLSLGLLVSSKSVVVVIEPGRELTDCIVVLLRLLSSGLSVERLPDVDCFSFCFITARDLER